MRRLLAALVIVVIASSSAAAAKQPARLLVTATEFRFALSRATIAGGSALVELSNRGEDAHDLVLRRLSAQGRETGPRLTFTETAAGGLTRRTLTLARGRYVLYCSLPSHRAAGMRARLRVR